MEKKKITWKEYLAVNGLKAINVWKNEEAFYVYTKNFVSSSKGFSEIRQGGRVVKLLIKDTDNENIVGDVIVVWENPNLAKVFKDSMQRLSQLSYYHNVKEIHDIWESLRSCYVTTNEFSGLDLDFQNIMIMMGFSQNEFDIYNAVSLAFAEGVKSVKK